MSQAVTPIPPFLDTPITSDNRFSTAWNQHMVDISNTLASLTARMGVGVTDGSDATAGQIGEYMTATGSGVALATGVLATIATITLTAGDWDVTGNVGFTAAAGTHAYFGVGIDGMDTLTTATFPAAAMNQSMNASVRRYSVTASTAVNLVAQASFTSTVTASGTIRARRMR
ncbi:MAG TPA: hypothetical protein VGI78_02345 [Acetobacteraceae bacterium]|jgi:hypothetical protein